MIRRHYYMLLCSLLVIALSPAAGAQNALFGWAKKPGRENGTVANDLAIDRWRNVITIGEFTQPTVTDFDPGPGTYYIPVSSNQHSYISKLNANGAFVWAKAIGGSGFDKAAAVTTDSAGNIYLAGRFESTADFDPAPASNYSLSSNGGADIYVLKLDSAGNFIWARKVGAGGTDEATDIAVDKKGNVYTTGYFSGFPDFDPGTGVATLGALNYEIFVWKLNAAGNYVWARSAGSINNDRSNSIAVDDSSNVYTTGYYGNGASFDTAYLNAQNPYDAFVWKLDSAGIHKWVVQLGSSDEEEGKSIALDGKGNVITAGYFDNAMDMDPGPGNATVSPQSYGCGSYYFSKLTTNGAYVWGAQAGGVPYTCLDYIRICTDTGGNIYATGIYGDSSDFDPGPGKYILNTSGIGGPNFDADIFVCRINANGTFGWAKGFGSPNSQGEIGFAIQSDSALNIYSTGVFSDTVDFDPGPAVYNLYNANLSLYYPDQGTYILKLGQCGPKTTTLPAVTACRSYTLNATTYTHSGNYVQTFPILTGCDSFVSININIPVVNTGITNTGTTLTANATGAVYQWLNCDSGMQAIPGETAQSYSPAANGNYAVAVTDHGCTDTSACIAVSGVGINTPLGSQGIAIYPNPTDGTLNVRSYSGIPMRVRLLNILGVVLQEVSSTSGNVALSVNGYAPGSYVIDVITDRGRELRPVRLIN